MKELLKENLDIIKGMSHSTNELFIEYFTRQVKHNLKLTN